MSIIVLIVLEIAEPTVRCTVDVQHTNPTEHEPSETKPASIHAKQTGTAWKYSNSTATISHCDSRQPPLYPKTVAT